MPVRLTGGAASASSVEKIASGSKEGYFSAGWWLAASVIFTWAKGWRRTTSFSPSWIMVETSMMVRSDGLATMLGLRMRLPRLAAAVGCGAAGGGVDRGIGFGRNGQLLAPVERCEQGDAHQEGWR